MIITIDGPIATGKSTIARKVSEQLGFIYFDTGAMYRSLTYGIQQHRIPLNDHQALKDYLQGFKFDFRVIKGEKRYFIDGEDISLKIRGHEVTSMVSEVSALKEVREKLVEMQRELSLGINVVFEGRDMGTVVFPGADLKIFLTGKAEIRAQRRFDELKAKLPEEAKQLTIDKMIEEINERDLYDSTRVNSPLKKASDAVEIDTSELSIDEVVGKILDLAEAKKNRKLP